MATAPAPAAEKSEAAAPPKKKSKVKLILLVVGLGVVLGGGGLFVLGRGAEKKEEKKAEADQENAKKDQGAEKTRKVVTLKPIIVNVRDTRCTRYLKVTIAVETSSESVVDGVSKLTAPINDFLLDTLSSLRIEEVDNTASRNKLKEQLLHGLNELLENGGLTRLYFVEFVVQ